MPKEFLVFAHTHTRTIKKHTLYGIDHEALCIMGNFTFLLDICQTYTTVGNNPDFIYEVPASICGPETVCYGHHLLHPVAGT